MLHILNIVFLRYDAIVVVLLSQVHAINAEYKNYKAMKPSPSGQPD